jgi:hypothetical protein
MSYSQICPECGFRSGMNKEICPGCGARKSLNIDESGASAVLYHEVDSSINFIDNPSLYVKILVSLIILFAGIFFLPDFLRNSEAFWIAYTITNVFTVIKAADKHFKLHGLYFYSLILLVIYLGAGIGNLIAYTGRNTGFKITHYFNPNFLYNQLVYGNPLIIVGAVAGAGFLLIGLLIKKSLKEN